MWDSLKFDRSSIGIYRTVLDHGVSVVTEFEWVAPDSSRSYRVLRWNGGPARSGFRRAALDVDQLGVALVRFQFSSGAGELDSLQFRLERSSLDAAFVSARRGSCLRRPLISLHLFGVGEIDGGADRSRRSTLFGGQHRCQMSGALVPPQFRRGRRSGILQIRRTRPALQERHPIAARRCTAAVLPPPSRIRQKTG